MDDPYSAGWVAEFKATHFPALVSFINSELDMDTLVSIFDPVWKETLPTSYMFNLDGELVKQVQGKNPLNFSGKTWSPLGYKSSRFPTVSQLVR